MGTFSVDPYVDVKIESNLGLVVIYFFKCKIQKKNRATIQIPTHLSDNCSSISPRSEVNNNGTYGKFNTESLLYFTFVQV
ncbi:hypothetical protein GDO86_000459 [Hymenochirus boettgeri]|uniref:Uncharacterized protein n=1 Tax=Hymenochirus boettgeri TaxID=247094 RepID=A0A8T2KHJ5_9PIPI|nr:hypothetical protein GDO86_000459 [Hymenochirus boettgeri]